MKNKIVDATGGDFVKAAKKIKKILPAGNQVLVQRITEDELIGSSFVISTQKQSSNQGYIVAIGPTVSKDCGLNVGDRVLLQGSFVPVPQYDGDNDHEQNLVFPDMIKGIILE